VPQTTFIVSEDFQALRTNAVDHRTLLLEFNQADNNARFDSPYDESLSFDANGNRLLGATVTETLTRNRAPILLEAERPRFRQAKFSGKPLTDDEMAHASRALSELEDETILRKLSS